jgi:hypothetical protein
MHSLGYSYDCVFFIFVWAEEERVRQPFSCRLAFHKRESALFCFVRLSVLWNTYYELVLSCWCAAPFFLWRLASIAYAERVPLLTRARIGQQHWNERARSEPGKPEEPTLKRNCSAIKRKIKLLQCLNEESQFLFFRYDFCHFTIEVM